MDMAAQFQEHQIFHLTGRRTGIGLEPIDGLGLRPALLAGYRDLTRLRYDFPLVLAQDGAAGGFVRSLSAVVNEVLAEIAPRGIEGERLRGDVLRLECEIRGLLAAGSGGKLSELWRMAAERVGAGDDALKQVLLHTAAALKVDGELVDCGPGMPARLVMHAWRAVQEEKARRFRADVAALITKLSDILRAAFLRSAAGRRADSLRAAVGTPHQQVFDFEAMSRLLRHAPAGEVLPPRRRQRIEQALDALKQQRFYPQPQGGAAYEFVFDSCSAAAEAFRQRLPQMAELVKAMAIAELEVAGRYFEAEHDAFFADFDEQSLGISELAMFPDYLVVIDAADTATNAKLMEVLSSELPVKVLAQTSDIVEQPSLGEGHFPFGVRSVQLASTAIGLGDVFVLQAGASMLYQMRERIHRGLTYPGPALFSVYAGPAAGNGVLPPYLAAAAAVQSRAFPTFTYDPAAGHDWASRFSVEDNPQPEDDWPVEPLTYADEDLQRVTEELPFTFVDFIACDRRHAGHFARVPRAFWTEDMAPVGEWLKAGARTASGKVPYLLMIDEADRLHRVLVDERLIRAARRCGEMWRRLQELGGIHNSHAERLLAQAKAQWEQQKQRELEALRGAAAAATAVPPSAEETVAASPATAGTAAAAAAEPEKPSADTPYIETPRCTSCNECTQINDRMFAYDANKQAYIADPKAGTYRQLVEAAESCQVAIIHPGKPLDPNEPGLDELIKRAEPFL
ncbi:MAG: ferredoxin [Burkholderiales bacterium]